MIIDCSFLIVSNCQPGEGEEEADMQTPSKWKQEAAGHSLDSILITFCPCPCFCAILSCVLAWLAWCLVSRYLCLPGAMAAHTLVLFSRLQTAYQEYFVLAKVCIEITSIISFHLIQTRDTFFETLWRETNCCYHWEYNSVTVEEHLFKVCQARLSYIIQSAMFSAM